MTTVVIDGPTRDKLIAAGGVVEVRDEAGTLLGRFVKLTQVGPHVIEGEWPSDEELDRRMREGRRFTAAEVEQRLRKLNGAVE